MLLVVVVAGVLLTALGSGTVQLVGVTVLSLCAVAAVSLFFLEIGYSEDRERQRDRERGG